MTGQIFSAGTTGPGPGPSGRLARRRPITGQGFCWSGPRGRLGARGSCGRARSLGVLALPLTESTPDDDVVRQGARPRSARWRRAHAGGLLPGPARPLQRAKRRVRAGKSEPERAIGTGCYSWAAARSADAVAGTVTAADGATRSTRASRVGSHQFARPNSATIAGTSRHRTTTASTRIPAPSPVARIFRSVSDEVD